MSEARAKPAAGSAESAAVVELEKAQVARAQAGDRSALKTVLMRHGDALYSHVILPRVGNVAAAEDILKGTMLQAMEKLDTFQWRGRSIYFWLRQIAANKVIDYHRANQRGRKMAEAFAREAELRQPCPAGAEKALIAEEERRINRERIEAATARLNPRYRRAIELRLVQERSRQECAAELDISVGTFDVLLFRAVRAFRKNFGER